MNLLTKLKHSIKLISKSYISQIWLNTFGSLLFVAMASPRMILQSVPFLNHAIKELSYMYDAMGSLYPFTKGAKIDFKIAK